MVQAPSRLSGDGLLAFCAEPVLVPPQVRQFLFPLFTVSQLSTQSFFEIGLPGRIEGIGVPLDLDVPDDLRVARVDERHLSGSLGVLAGKGPLSAVYDL